MPFDEGLDLEPLRRLIAASPDYGVNWGAPPPIPLLTIPDESRECSPLSLVLSNSVTLSDSLSDSSDCEDLSSEAFNKDPYHAAEAAMTSACFTMKAWKKIKIKEEKKAADDEDIDNQVHQLEGAPLQHWQDLVDSMAAKKQEYVIDYIIAAEPELTADQLTKRRWVLIKWNKFALPTWQALKDVNTTRTKDDLVMLFKNRLELMAKLETKLRSNSPNFDQDFPRRWLRTVQTRQGTYVEDEHSKYLNRLRAWEWRINYEYQKTFTEVAPIYVENWVDDAAVPPARDMRFITKLCPSPKVTNILANTDELSWLTCAECTPTCSFPKERFSHKTNCCGVIYNAAFHYLSKKLVSRCSDFEKESENYQTPPGLTTLEINADPIVECLDTCECGTDSETGKTVKCSQMLVQRGRQIPLIIFREDQHKGWGVRAAAKISIGEFVSEYIGEVVTAKESAELHKGSHYTFDMRYGWMENLQASNRLKNRRAKNEQRLHKPFSIDSTHMGNEARYINHSCEPNLIAMAVYVERHGEFYHRIALFARKHIEFGEELSIDYFPNGSTEDKMNFKFMFDQCRCGTDSCKFKDLPDAEEQDHEDCMSVDSHMSDDEEYERQKAEVADRRKQLDSAVEGETEKEEKKEMRRGLAERQRSEQHSEQVSMENDGSEANGVENTDMPSIRPNKNMRRSEMELIKERCYDDEEMAQRIVHERATSGGALDVLSDEPWSEALEEGLEEDFVQATVKAEKVMEGWDAIKGEVKEEMEDEMEEEGDEVSDEESNENEESED